MYWLIDDQNHSWDNINIKISNYITYIFYFIFAWLLDEEYTVDHITT